MIDTVFEGDYLTLLSNLPDNSVDMVLTDPPYGQTQNFWDKPINLTAFWQEVNRVVKDTSAMVVFTIMPFGADVIQANRRYFRYEWIWEKHNATGHLDANNKPMRLHEQILIFGRKRPNYYPVMTVGELHIRGNSGLSGNYGVYDKLNTIKHNEYFPTTILKFAHSQDKLHPTQKPVDLLAYLINTYTLPGEVVLDPFCGSGSVGVACVRTGRHFIMGDSHAPYCEIARQRVASPIQMELLT